MSISRDELQAVPDALDILSAVNQCQISELKKAAETLDPAVDCAEFFNYVRNVQSAVIHTYQMTAYASIRESEPKKAAAGWKSMVDFCDRALNVLHDLKASHQNCGTAELYDLALDYRGQAHKRYLQNLQDSECQTIPPGLFAKAT